MNAGCKGKIDGNDQWIGLWAGNKSNQIYFIDIQTRNGASSYEKVGEDPLFGTVRINEKEAELKIGDALFEINHVPKINEITDKLEMMVEGVGYVKN